MINIRQRVEPYKPTRYPLLTGNEKQAYSYLFSECFEKKYSVLEEQWKSLSSEKQHEEFLNYVASVKVIHSDQVKSYQTISATLGRRDGVIKRITGFEPSKKDKKDKGSLLHKLWGDFLKVEPTSISNDAKLALHPLVPLSGTSVLEKYEELRRSEKKVSDSKVDVRITSMLNLEEMWTIRYGWSREIPVPSAQVIKETNKFGILDIDND
jgi:hypothetical protein